MLDKINRLTQDKEFDNVFKLGRASYSQILGIKTAANKKSNSRFGVLISTKISKKAVARNKLKRQIREIIQSQITKIKPGYDIVVITFPLIIKADYKKLEKTINQNLKKLSLYK